MENSLVALGVIGFSIAGFGTWWYRRSSDANDDESPAESGSTGGAKNTQPKTPTSGATDAGGESLNDDASSYSGVFATVNATVEGADALRKEARNHRDAGEYDRALTSYDDARSAYEEALNTASGNSLVNTSEIKQKRDSIENERRETRRQQLYGVVETLYSDFNRVDELMNNDPEKAKSRLTDLESRLRSATETATRHGFEDLHDALTTLKQRREADLSEVTERSESHPVSDATAGDDAEFSGGENIGTTATSDQETSEPAVDPTAFEHRFERARTALVDRGGARSEYEGILEAIETTVADIDDEELTEDDHARTETLRARAQRGYVQARLEELATRLDEAEDTFHAGAYETAQREFTGITQQLSKLHSRIDEEANPLLALSETTPDQFPAASDEHQSDDSEDETSDEEQEAEDEFETLTAAIDALQAQAERFRTSAQSLRNE